MSGEDGFLVTDSVSFTVSSRGKGHKEFFGALIPFTRAPPLQLNHVPRAPPACTLTLGLGFPHELWGTQVFPPLQGDKEATQLPVCCLCMNEHVETHGQHMREVSWPRITTCLCSLSGDVGTAELAAEGVLPAMTCLAG